MGIQEDYQQALSLAKQGKYQEAQRLLVPHKENPKIKGLIERINTAQVKQPQPKEKSKHTCRNLGIGCFVIILFLGLGFWGIIFYQSVTVSNFTLQFKWEFMCYDIAIDAIIESDIDFSDKISEAYREECNRQAVSMLRTHHEEIEFCYWETNRAKLERHFQECLVDNEAFIDGLILGAVINNAR